MAIDFTHSRNLSMLVDFYEITMSNGYFQSGYDHQIAVFDMFFRKIPDDGGFALFAGLEQLIGYLNQLSFSDEDIEYLRTKRLFSDDFLKYLRNFQFSCDVWAVKEGTPIFPNEPVVTIRGPVIQAQMVETLSLIHIYYSLSCFFSSYQRPSSCIGKNHPSFSQIIYHTICKA